MLKRISQLLLLCILTQASHQLRAQESAVDILVKWNSYHNNQELSSFRRLYHDSVFYYGKNVSNDYCSNSKSRALSGKSYSQHLQNVQERALGKYFIRLDFDKLVTYNGKTTSYPSYIVLRRGEEGLKICVEGDKLTDRTLTKKYRSNIPKDCITGDFDGDGQLEKAWVVRPEIMDADLGCPGGCYVKIRFSESSIPEIKAHGIGGTLTNLTDLNEDGIDEVGMERWWFQGCWQPYFIFTNIQYGWYNPITFETHCDQPHFPVEFNHQTGMTILNEAIMSEETEWQVGTFSKTIKLSQFK